MYKYDRKIHKEIPYTPPVKGGNYPVYCDSMDEKVNCAQCGKEIKYGNGYVSIEIFSGAFGHTVCEECHEKEWEKRCAT